MNNKLYEGQKLNDFRELVDLYKTKYKDLIAFEYKETPESKYHFENDQNKQQLAGAYLSRSKRFWIYPVYKKIKDNCNS